MHIKNFFYNVLPSTISGENWQNKRKTERNLTHLLRISAVCNWFVFDILKNDVLQRAVRNVLHNVPLDKKATSPLVLLPVFNCLVKINPTHHLSQTNKLSTGVNLKNRGRQVTSTSNLTHRFTEGEKGSLIEDKDQTYRKQQEHLRITELMTKLEDRAS